MATANGHYEEVAAAQEILDAMTCDGPTKNDAIRILREMKNILMQTGSGDEHGFVDNILREMAKMLPKE